MRDYTPTAGIVKGAYMIHKFQHEHVELEDSAAEFDRWLAEHDRQIAAAAWEEGFDYANYRHEKKDIERDRHNPYRRGDQQ